METYGIKHGYRINSETFQPQYSDEASLAYQQSVYKYARDLILERRLRSVLDIGCGLGLKLERYIRPTAVTITGVDGPETIASASGRHEFGRWIVDDIEAPTVDLGQRFDLVISSDVIEHLDNPDHLLKYAVRWAAENAPIILSTPERDLRRGPDDMGPPRNRSHVREWNRAELGDYLCSRGMHIDEHRIVALLGDELTNQLVLCRWTGKR